jgi:hypothetical protein
VDQPNAQGLVHQTGRATAQEIAAVRAALRAFDPRRVTIDSEEARVILPAGDLTFTAAGRSTRIHASSRWFEQHELRELTAALRAIRFRLEREGARPTIVPGGAALADAEWASLVRTAESGSSRDVIAVSEDGRVRVDSSRKTAPGYGIVPVEGARSEGRATDDEMRDLRAALARLEPGRVAMPRTSFGPGTERTELRARTNGGVAEASGDALWQDGRYGPAYEVLRRLWERIRRDGRITRTWQNAMVEKRLSTDVSLTGTWSPSPGRTTLDRLSVDADGNAVLDRSDSFADGTRGTRRITGRATDEELSSLAHGLAILGDQHLGDGLALPVSTPDHANEAELAWSNDAHHLRGSVATLLANPATRQVLDVLRRILERLGSSDAAKAPTARPLQEPVGGPNTDTRPPSRPTRGFVDELGHPR